MYTEEQFLEKVYQVYNNNEIEVIGRYKGATKPILFKTKYGICQYSKANFLFTKTDSFIKSALNKTEYFMNQLKEKYPEIAEQITPKSEYEAMKKKMLFENQFGLVSISPDALLSGHCPNIRSAVNRKDYFKNQLLYLYDNKYDFIITSTDRHKGRVTLICPIHGEQSIDSDGIFLGIGCPECNKEWTKSNVFYLIRLFNDKESFYKLGISFINIRGKVNRYKDYKKLGYNIDEIKILKFEDFVECRNFETKMRRLISNNLYTPENWPSNSSVECFQNDLLPVILNNVLEYDIVSTSSESQSSSNKNGEEVTNPLEENEI